MIAISFSLVDSIIYVTSLFMSHNEFSITIMFRASHFAFKVCPNFDKRFNPDLLNLKHLVMRLLPSLQDSL